MTGRPRAAAREEPPPRGRWPLPAALAATLLFVLWRALAGDPWTDAFDRWTVDLRFELRGPWPAGEQAAVIAIDEAALTEFGHPAALRDALARALPLILAAEPSAVALDLLLVEPSPSDVALAAALARSPRVLLAAAGLNAAPGTAPDPSSDLEAALDRSAIPLAISRGAPPGPPVRLLAPTDGLARAARLGHVNLRQGADRTPREAPLALPVGAGRLLPSIALAAAAIARDAPLELEHDRQVRFGGRVIDLQPGDRVIIDHPGGPGVIAEHPLGALLAGQVPPEALRGRMVFVGATAESLRDVFVTPYAASMSGATVLAGLAAGLAEGRVIRRGPAVEIAAGALALLLCLACWAAYARRMGRWGPPAAAGVALLGAAAAQTAFAGVGPVAGGVWLDGASLGFGVAAGLLAGAARRRLLAGQERATLGRERANLAGFAPPALADLMARGGAGGFERRAQDAAVIFADVEGFTALAERMSPLETADFLARLHTVFEAESAAHGGVVVDWQGDGAMIVFGLPEPAPDDAARAVVCAEALAQGAPARLAGLAPGAPPRVRVSLHHGATAAAALGGERQAVLTLAGDTVNLASRLQDIARASGRRLVATREALDAAGADAAGPGWRFLESARIRGRDAPAEVWTRDLPGEPPAA